MLTVKNKKSKRRWFALFVYCVVLLLLVFLYEYAGVYCYHVVLVCEKRVDVHFLYLGSIAQQGREAHDDVGIFLLVESLLSACSLDNLVSAQRVNHVESFVV